MWSFEIELPAVEEGNQSGGMDDDDDGEASTSGRAVEERLEGLREAVVREHRLVLGAARRPWRTRGARRASWCAFGLRRGAERWVRVRPLRVEHAGCPMPPTVTR